MHLRDKLLFISLLAIASILYITPVLAAQNNLSSRLLINLGVLHDSNFYYDQIDERGVTTFLVQPGIDLEYETGKSEFALFYMLNANYYDESAEDDFYGHTVSFMGDIALSDRLSLYLSDDFLYSRDTSELDELGNIRTREKYYRNRLRVIYTLDFEPKFTTRLGYQNWITDYKEDFSTDSTGNQGIFDLIYHLNKSTSLDFEYHYWDMAYDGPISNYTSNQLSLVARKEFRIIDLEAAVGYQKRKFDEAGLEDIEVIPYRFKLSGKSSSGKTRFSLSAAQNYNFLERSDEGYYEANRISATLDYDLTGKITFGASGYYQNSDYENSLREDDNYDILAYVNYQIREKIALYFSAGYENRDSTIASEEYENTEILGQVKFFHDIAK